MIWEGEKGEKMEKEKETEKKEKKEYAAELRIQLESQGPAWSRVLWLSYKIWK